MRSASKGAGRTLASNPDRSPRAVPLLLPVTNPPSLRSYMLKAKSACEWSETDDRGKFPSPKRSGAGSGGPARRPEELAASGAQPDPKAARLAQRERVAVPDVWPGNRSRDRCRNRRGSRSGAAFRAYRRVVLHLARRDEPLVERFSLRLPGRSGNRPQLAPARQGDHSGAIRARGNRGD